MTRNQKCIVYDQFDAAWITGAYLEYRHYQNKILAFIISDTGDIVGNAIIVVPFIETILIHSITWIVTNDNNL